MIQKKEIFYSEVMNKLLGGLSPDYLNALRHQYQNSTMREENTGCGFYINFHVAGVQPLKNGPTFRIADVYAEINGSKDSAGFILFVKNGLIDVLEGYTYGDSWPEDIISYRLYYKGDKERNISALEKFYQ